MYLVYFLLKLHLKFQDIAAKNCVGVKIKKRSLKSIEFYFKKLFENDRVLNIRR